MASPRTASELAWLSAIVLIGFALRIYGITWGPPEYVFPDSWLHFIRPAVALAGQGDFALSKSELVHPPVLVYLIGGVYFLWSLATGSELSTEGLQGAATLPTFVLLGRLLCVAIALASIAAVYELGRRLFGARTGLFGAAVLALAPIHVLESHRINPNGIMILLMLLASLLAVIAEQRRDTRPLMAGFAVAGLAGAAKYTGVFGGAIPAWIALTWLDSDPKRRAVLAIRGGFLFLAGFLFGMLPAVVDPRRFLHTIELFATVGFVTGAPGYGYAAEGWANTRFVYAIVVALPYSMGWPGYLAGLAGIVAAARHAKRNAGIVVAFLTPYFLMQAGSQLVVARYFEPLVPFLAITAGVALDRLCASRRRIGPWVSAALLAYTLALSTSHAARLSHEPQERVVGYVSELAAREGTKSKPVIVGYWGKWPWWYDTIRPRLAKLDIEIVHIPAVYVGEASVGETPTSAAEWLEYDRRWIAATQPRIIILPSWSENSFLRDGPEDETNRFSQRLADGSLGFRLGENYRSRFLNQNLYVWGDPMLEAHWETATTGYKIFVREDAEGPR